MNNTIITYDKDFDWDLIIEEQSKIIAAASPPPTIQIADAYINRGYARCFNTPKDDTYTEAIADCSNAILINPAKASYYAKRAYAYGLNGQYDRAIADCNRIIAPVCKDQSKDSEGKVFNITDTETAFAHELLGNIYSTLKNLPEAIEHYKAAIKLNKNSPGLLDKYRDACKKLNNN